MTEREREIEAREKAATSKPLRKDRQVNREQEGVTLSGDTLVINVWDADTPQAEEAWATLIQHAKADLSYLLAQLREARGKLEAVEERIKFHSTCFKESPCILPAELLRILHPQEAE